MQSAARYALVLVTVPDRRVGRKLIQTALEQRLVACGNLVPGIESHYWWKGKLESSRESLIVFKTAKKQLAQLETMILKQHPYETPEILAVPLGSGTASYLKWISTSIDPGAPR